MRCSSQGRVLPGTETHIAGDLPSGFDQDRYALAEPAPRHHSPGTALPQRVSLLPLCHMNQCALPAPTNPEVSSRGNPRVPSRFEAKPGAVPWAAQQLVEAQRVGTKVGALHPLVLETRLCTYPRGGQHLPLVQTALVTRSSTTASMGS
jgi:hypothetical protein